MEVHEKGSAPGTRPPPALERGVSHQQGQLATGMLVQADKGMTRCPGQLATGSGHAGADGQGHDEVPRHG